MAVTFTRPGGSGGTDITTYVDGLEALITSTNGYVDGLETLITSTNTYVDGLETLITSTNTKLDTLNTTCAAITGGAPVWKQLHTGALTGSIVEIRGYNIVATSAKEECLWTRDTTDYTGRLGSAQVLKISSLSANDTNTAGTGARKVTITGLDTNYGIISESVNLNGTTDVSTANSYIRVNSMEVTEVGSGGSNASVILAEDNASTTAIAEIYTGFNNNWDGHYTVPSGYTLYLTDVDWTCDTGEASAMFYYINEYDNTANGVKIRRLLLKGFDSTANGHLTQSFANAPLKFTQKKDITFTQLAGGATGNSGSVFARGFLVAN